MYNNFYLSTSVDVFDDSSSVSSEVQHTESLIDVHIIDDYVKNRNIMKVNFNDYTVIEGLLALILLFSFLKFLFSRRF